MRAYYNEWDKFAAAWLRELIKAGQIMEGDVDERDIWDVRPDELRGYTRVHLFAGIGGWDYALRLAGWPDDRPVWTASCPCQPFSAAGKRGGMSDERHLWPAAFHLIEAVRPECVFGEQVASRDGLAWLDLVLADLDGAGYAAGAVDCCAAGVGAPHIRQRLYFVAKSDGSASQRYTRGVSGTEATICGKRFTDGRESDGPTDDRPSRLVADAGHAERGTEQQAGGAREWRCRLGGSGELGDSGLTGLAGRESERGDDGAQQPTAERAGGRVGESEGSDGKVPVHERGQVATMSEPRGTGGPCNGAWADAEWIPCRDGKARPAQPGAFPLAHGVPARVGRLRGYGNAIVPPLAAEVVRAVLCV